MNVQRKPGDWNCKYCQHLNFSRRDFCQKCRNPRSDLQFSDGHGTGGVLTSLDIRPGDWYCTCGYHNFASRSSCFNCGTIVRDFPAGQGAEGGRDSAAVRAGWKAGDWICTRPGCNVHNFASRTECYRCNAPRESGPGNSYYSQRPVRGCRAGKTKLQLPTPPEPAPVVAMAIHLRSHAFASNPLRDLSASTAVSPSAAAEALRSLLDPTAGGDAATPPHAHLSKILPFRRGRPLALSPDAPPDAAPAWRLAWLPPSRVAGVPPDAFVFLGAHGEEGGKEAAAYWAVDVGEGDAAKVGGAGNGSAFVELRTLMVAADWTDKDAMGELAIAGHARALLEWHTTAKFCGACGAKAVPTEAGRRKQCSNESCKKRIYPRVDPVVIMLVIDKENDRALLSRQSRFVPRMWSCLAGFIEPGESLEEAVRRETLEETGIEVGQVIYHSSQPWPVGPSTMPCQLMVGFFAYAKSLEIHVDKKELEDAQWHSREDIKRALMSAEYDKTQRANAFKVDQICKGAEKGQGLSSDFKVESSEPAPMFFPGPFAIAHHLISSWAFEGAPKMPSSFSNL
ncbi:hypothetical protein QOZ80_6AG0508170 [Eleusine coracana subsp. coracana]|nr:hypothetical protein QOZ80_6AG0508170 [Eleusine coracana subsp. coracana]